MREVGTTNSVQFLIIRLIKPRFSIRFVQQFNYVNDLAVCIEHPHTRAKLHVATGIRRRQNFCAGGFHLFDLVGKDAFGHFRFAEVVNACAASLYHALGVIQRESFYCVGLNPRRVVAAVQACLRRWVRLI